MAPNLGVALSENSRIHRQGGMSAFLPEARLEHVLRFATRLPADLSEARTAPASYVLSDGKERLLLRLQDGLLCVDLSGGESGPLHLQDPLPWNGFSFTRLMTSVGGERWLESRAIVGGRRQEAYHDLETGRRVAYIGAYTPPNGRVRHVLPGTGDVVTFLQESRLTTMSLATGETLCEAELHVSYPSR
jgi:hypothetical protein